MSDHDLRLLALDGGGVRGLSSLIILEQLMKTINPNSPPKPCDYFDMIGGTSTGGIIAIMLGRLRMSIGDCINAYLSLSDRVFQKKSSRLAFTGMMQGRFDSKELERAVKEVVTAQGLSEDTLLKDASNDACKVFVCTTRKETSEAAYLTTYRSPRDSDHLLDSVKIWEACRATSAAPSFFDSIALGPYKEEFVDGATGANNPVFQVWDQAQSMWGPQPIENRIQCLVSIGTGIPKLKAFGDNPIHIGKTLIAMATETEQTAEKFQGNKTHLDKIGRYYRFNVNRGLEEIGLEESKKKNNIAAATHGYIGLHDVYKKMQECANNMSGREHFGEYRTIFNLEGVAKVKTFVSRSTEMENLEHALLPQRQSRRQKIFVLHGLGGMGKTQLAVEFARLHHRRFSSVFWLDGRSEASLKRSVAKCASSIPEGQISETSRTHYAGGNGDLDEVVKEVMNWLAQPHNTDWLLVIDNVDLDSESRNPDPDAYDVKHYLSGADHGAILITTRLAKLEQLGNSQQLRKVDRYQAEAILQVWYTRQYDTVEAHRLLDLLDGLPLAIAQAGAYLEQSGVGLGKYLKFYEQQWKELMKINDEDGALLQEYPDRSVCTTWTISYNTIREKDQNAANLLMLWAFLDNRDLWYGLFAAASTVAASELSEWIGDIASSELHFSNAMRLLRNYSLVENMEYSMGYATHPVLHRWAYYFQDEASREELAQLAVVIVGYALPNLSNRDYSTIVRRLLPHAEACSRWVLAGEMERKAMTRSTDEVDFDEPAKNGTILDAIALLGDLYYNQGRLRDAEKMYERALRGYEASATKHIPEINLLVGMLGGVHTQQGKFIEAEKMIKKALQGYEDLFGTTHMSTLHTVDDLGTFYRKVGDLANAEKMYKRALRGYEASGTEHISTLLIRNKLGTVYEDQGNLAEAEKMCNQALQGLQEAVGAKHIYTLSTANDLGRVYLRQNKLAKAEEMFKGALRGEDEALGAKHLTTLGTINHLGVLYTRQGKRAEAEKMYKRAIQGGEEVLGPHHEFTLDAVNNLGVLYANQGKVAEAEKMYKRAIQGYEEALGADHEVTLTAINNLRLLAIDSDQR